MLITKNLGNLASFDAKGMVLDRLPLEWYETGKRILRRLTEGGRDVSLKLTGKAVPLTEGDLLYIGDGIVIVVRVLECSAIVMHPVSWQEAAAICYEIGNKHLPLFVDEDALIVPFDAPLMRQLVAAGYDCRKEDRVLLHPLKTSVSAHGHSGEGLLSKILHLTNPGS